MLVSYALGDFSGCVIVVPLMLALRDHSAAGAWARCSRTGWCWARAGRAGPGQPSGPRGAGISAVCRCFRCSASPTASVAAGRVARPAGRRHPLRSTGALRGIVGAGQLQLLVAVAGCAALLLGVAARPRSTARALSATVQALSMRSTQLAEAANRMASLQEQERRRIGAELHDQLGQDMTAIATRLRVVERTRRRA